MSEVFVVVVARRAKSVDRIEREKNVYRSTSAIRIFGTYSRSGPITCQPGLGLSEVREASETYDDLNIGHKGYIATTYCGYCAQ
jgi:hypothetical protein